MIAAPTKCRVSMSGFLASKRQSDNNLPNGMSGLDSICRVCRVLFTKRELRRITLAAVCNPGVSHIADSAGLE